MQWIDDDTLQQILAASISTPSSFASACRVNKAWRRVCTRDDSLLLKCATSRPYITKRDLVGLFALSNNEAESLPREISTASEQAASSTSTTPLSARREGRARCRWRRPKVEETTGAKGRQRGAGRESVRKRLAPLVALGLRVEERGRVCRT